MRTVHRLALCSLLGFCSLTVSAQTILRLSHAGSLSSSQHLAALRMAEVVKEKTQGALRIDVYPESQLGNDAKAIADTQKGALDMVMAGSPNFVPLAPRLVEIDLPYSFDTPQRAYGELDSKFYGQSLLNEPLAKGIKGLAFWEVGFRIITSNKGFVKTPDDLKGLRLRVVGNPEQHEFFKALGAQTVAMPLGEVYEAIRAGKLDAQDHPLPITYSSRLYEVQKYVTMTRHAYTALMVAINAGRFESLTAVQQKALMEAAVAGRNFQRELNAKNEKTILADLRRQGVNVLESVDSRPFRLLATKQSANYFSRRLGLPELAQNK
ncbi:TRAP transporter substrate-binding protein [Polaromonas sp. JS666]|uniref:TRAP transporter substrate-binding protein n=1 Tax=Polaromonas sp. (strain JS666 / ATCC BAA-500) TaxID=296591 RepID=UPI0000463E90|nr:TRAP transporter substrate-binding protein [Polaromonas sp. JS666]